MALRDRLLLRKDYKPVIAYVGRIDRQKGAHLIHHAIFYALAQGAQFVLLGEHLRLHPPQIGPAHGQVRRRAMPLFHVTVREHTYTGRFYHEVVEAESFEDALQLAAGRATAPQPPPGSEPEPGGANHR